MEVSLGAGFGDGGGRALQLSLPAQLGMEPEDLQRIRCVQALPAAACRQRLGMPAAACVCGVWGGEQAREAGAWGDHVPAPPPDHASAAGTACMPAASSTGSRPPSSGAS